MYAWNFCVLVSINNVLPQMCFGFERIIAFLAHKGAALHLYRTRFKYSKSTYVRSEMQSEPAHALPSLVAPKKRTVPNSCVYPLKLLKNVFLVGKAILIEKKTSEWGRKFYILF